MSSSRRDRSRCRKFELALAVVVAGAMGGVARAQTAATWVGPAGGSWTDAFRWSTDPYYPTSGDPAGATYDASIAATGAGYVVGLSSGVTVHSFTLNSADATFAQSGGTFNAGAVSLLAGTYNATGGVLVASSIGGPGGMNIGGNFTISGGALGTAVDVGAGGTLTMAGSWTNPTGSITAESGGTVLLTGLMNSWQIGNVRSNGGRVAITGVVNNAGATVAINANTGPWQLSGSGTIGNGTVSGVGANDLVAIGGTLTGVTLVGDMTVGDGVASSASLVSSGTVFGAGARVTFNAPAGASVVSFLPAGVTPTLSGTAEFVFDGAGDGGVLKPQTSGQKLVLGTGITVRTGARGGTLGASASPVENRGLVSAQTAGRTVSVAGGFTNSGTVEARNGGTVSLAVTPTNLAGGTLTGGTWNVYDGSAIVMPGAVTTNAASVTLSGTGSSFAAVNGLAGNTGALTVTGGRVFATAGDLGNSGTVTVGAGSVLDVRGALNNAGKVDLAGGALVLDYLGVSPAEGLRGQLAVGRGSGAWDGVSGVGSSVAAGDGKKRIGVGYAEASQLGVTSWGGVGVDGTAVVTKVTYYGDANLDGRVDGDDYALADRGLAAHGNGWVSGDFNYDGVVDAADYLLMDRVFVQQGGVLSPGVMAAREAQFGTEYASQLALVLPEPAVVALLAAGVPLVMRRRR